MEPIEPANHPRTHAAQQAPRCQHIRLNGRRCAAPALRGQTHCHFHERIQPCALDSQEAEPHLPFIEDATSLQVVLNRVIRCINSGPGTYKTWGLMLYALQIACMNLKNFMAEHPQAEAEERERPQPKTIGAHKEKKVNGKNGDEPSLAEFLLGMLAKGDNGDPNAPPPRIRSREDFHAAVEQRQRSSAALPGETSLP